MQVCGHVFVQRSGDNSGYSSWGTVTPCLEAGTFTGCVTERTKLPVSEPRELLSLPPQYWDKLGIELTSSCLQSKHFCKCFTD